MKLTANIDIVDPLYLYYEFTSPRQLEYIRISTIQVGVPHTNLGILRDTPVELPPLNVQKKIAQILGTLDDKIDLNRRMNQTLESMAQAIFQSWFVDFDPVKAKIAATAHGHDPERAAMAAIAGKLAVPKDVTAIATAISSEDLDAAEAGLNQLSDEQRSQLAETAGLFPGELVESELGLIPLGWEVSSLDQIAKYRNGLALQKFPPEDDEFLPVIKIRELRQGYADNKSNRASPSITEECIIDDGDVIFSWSGSLLVELWCGGRGALNQHLFKVTSDKFPKWFYLYWTKHHLAEFQTVAEGKATTMGHIKRHHLTDAKVVVAGLNTIIETTNVFKPLIEKFILNATESKNLAQLRDTLLPKLLSGELTVSAAEEMVG